MSFQSPGGKIIQNLRRHVRRIYDEENVAPNTDGHSDGVSHDTNGSSAGICADR